MAECLAEQLSYPVLGREILQEAASRLSVSADELEQAMDSRPTLWSRFSTMRRVYITAVQATLAEHAAHGDLVYHGLAGGLLLRNTPAALCLRLIAPLADRVRAVMQESDMDAATAEAYIRHVDESRRRWVKMMYGEDILDPALYDLVISLETMTVEGACAVTVKMLAQPEFAITNEVRSKLIDFRTSCRVKLALLSETELRSLDLDAEAEDGVVVITGEAPVLKSGGMGRRIVELAREVPDVDEVRLRVDWFDPYP